MNTLTLNKMYFSTITPIIIIIRYLLSFIFVNYPNIIISDIKTTGQFKFF